MLLIGLLLQKHIRSRCPLAPEWWEWPHTDYSVRGILPGLQPSCPKWAPLPRPYGPVCALPCKDYASPCGPPSAQASERARRSAQEPVVTRLPAMSSRSTCPEAWAHNKTLVRPACPGPPLISLSSSLQPIKRLSFFNYSLR